VPLNLAGSREARSPICHLSVNFPAGGTLQEATDIPLGERVFDDAPPSRRESEAVVRCGNRFTAASKLKGCWRQNAVLAEVGELAAAL
jgi:hypothetical protein